MNPAWLCEMCRRRLRWGTSRFCSRECAQGHALCALAGEDKR